MNKKILTYAKIGFVVSAIAVSGNACLTYSADSRAEGEILMAEVDALLNEIESTTHAVQTEVPVYTWNQEMIGKVVGFEVGYCCDRCKYYVASACINRFYDWYSQDVIAMITDGNDQYYQMNPEYVNADQANGFNFWGHYYSIMEIVDYATYHPLEVYYWDNSDSQGEWAELVWHCQEDDCWFYR